jgi:hypothetical protein
MVPAAQMLQSAITTLQKNIAGLKTHAERAASTNFQPGE